MNKFSTFACFFKQAPRIMHNTAQDFCSYTIPLFCSLLHQMYSLLAELSSHLKQRVLQIMEHIAEHKTLDVV